MEFRFTDEQEMLRDAVRGTLRRVLGEAPPSAAAAAALWPVAVGQGWIGLTVPEAAGGAGLGVVDAVVLHEELGRALAPGPFLTNVVRLGALLRGGAGLGALAAAVAAGRAVAALGAPSGDGVLYEHPALATHVLVGGDAPALRRLPAGGGGARQAFDLTHPLGAVAPGALSDAVHLPPGAWAAAEAAARTAACAEIIGACARTLERTLDYVRERRQFGRPVGSFQAVKHALADVFVDLENTRTATYHAAWAWDAGRPDADLAIEVAASYAGETGPRLVGACIQAHGGVGFTWDSGLHLALRRVRRLAADLGDPFRLRASIARRILDAPPPMDG